MNSRDNYLAVWYGMIAGLLFSLLCFGIRNASIAMFATFLTYYAWLPIIFILFLIGAFHKRSRLGGFIAFKDALVFCFLAYLVYEVFYAITTYVLFTVIDPQLQEKLMPYIVDRLKSFLQGVGASQEQINDAVTKAQDNSKGSYSFSQILVGFGYALIFDFIKSAIIAGITQIGNRKFRNDQPLNT